MGYSGVKEHRRSLLIEVHEGRVVEVGILLRDCKYGHQLLSMLQLSELNEGVIFDRVERQLELPELNEELAEGIVVVL